MEWNNEVEKLSLGKDFLKLESGQHTIKFKSDGENKEVDFDGKKIKKVFFDVVYNGEDKIWTVTKGETLASLYGQLALIGRMNGTMIGQEITVLVKGEGKKTDYTIMESLELGKLEMDRRKKNGNKI